jgi:acyl-CoA synthetase (AMP-forming)/AMP-acid ligase II
LASKKAGRFHTGAVGFMVEAGRFHLVDRKKDMINAAGYKVWPRAVEIVEDLSTTGTGKIPRRELRG